MPFSSSCQPLSGHALKRKWEFRGRGRHGREARRVRLGCSRINQRGNRIAAQIVSNHRLEGLNRFRARVGEYRIIYTFQRRRRRIHLLAMGIGGKFIDGKRLRAALERAPPKRNAPAGLFVHFSIETPSLPKLSRHHPHGFTFYLSYPVGWIPGFLIKFFSPLINERH